jgi:2-polyprenyl-6-methoxyphenol hydroxylase-like FAD-dependent oxidoreductase
VQSFDVVIAGGGIAGSGIATVLARAGLSVCVVEPTTEYPDIVRGEWLANWGVAHAQATGLYDVLADAGGHHINRHITFDEGVEPEQALASPLPLDVLVPDVPGPLAIRHPVACQALADAASGAGAVVHRGATDVELRPDRVVAFAVDGAPQEATGRIVIGADGRLSPVRKAIGVELERFETDHFLAGILVDGLEFLGDDATQYAATEDGLHALCFPQGGGRARLYLSYDDGQKDLFAGTDRAAAYLRAFEMACWPGSTGFLDARAAGPAKGYRSVDTWCDRPFADGVVLVGDAAGHNDPLIGQGLSITQADIRAVTEALLSTDDWSPALFEDYGRERHERMRRLRGTARVYALAVSGRSWARDPDVRAALAANPMVQMLLATLMLGPYALPEEIYDQDGLEAVLAGPAA